MFVLEIGVAISSCRTGVSVVAGIICVNKII